MTLMTLIGGRIATLAGEHGIGWAEAIGISGGRVTVAGRGVDVEPLAESLARLEPEGVGCIYVKDLEAIDVKVLEVIVERSYATLTAGTYSF